MKTKGFFLAKLLFGAGIAMAQITPSITIPNPLPNYDGTYDDFGKNHLFYPNGGEIRYTNIDQSNAIEEVKFYTMYTEPKMFLMANNNISYCHYKPKNGTSGTDSLHRIDIEWQRSNASAVLARVDTQNFARLNYFTQWFASTNGRTNVQGGAAITCQSIYPNIDLVYTSNNAGLVMYFIVYPGGDYKDISMKINGAKTTSIVSNKLNIQANWDQSDLQKPQMYQYLLSGNVVTPVNVCNASWNNVGTDLYEIANTTSYNTSLPLIIQIKQATPLALDVAGLCWSTYFGASQSDFLTKTHCDANNNVYVGGFSSPGNQFPQNQNVTPLTNNNGDGVISKFNASNQLQWSTFVGGSSVDQIRDFDFSGNKIFCVGKTSSNNLPTVIKASATNGNDATLGNAGWDGFIFEFEFIPGPNTFQKNWLTYFGGNGDEELNGCKFDAAGNFFVIGEGASTDMTITGASGTYQQNFNAAQLNPNVPLSTDGIIAKFDAITSAKSWFTFFGTDATGTNAHNHAGDYLYGLTTKGTNLYVCGKTGGTNLPSKVNNKIVNGDFDGILAHFGTNGILNGSKYTDGNNVNYSVKTNFWGDVYTVGETNYAMNTFDCGLLFYDNSLSGTTDACFSIHDANLTTSTIHNSFLGGGTDEAAYDIQFAPNGLFLISGGTNSNNFPVTTLGTMFSQSAQGLNDNFISCFQKGSTNITWSSYLGSSTNNESLTYPPFLNSQFDIANSTLAIDNTGVVRLLGTSNSFNQFPLDNNGVPPPFFKGNTGGLANDATITCFDASDIGAIVGLSDFKNTEFVFGLYPNPTNKELSITNSALTKDDLRYAIYDAAGKKLKEGNLKSTEVKNIDVSFLQQGLYIINVSNGKMTYSNKFIKAEN